MLKKLFSSSRSADLLKKSANILNVFEKTKTELQEVNSNILARRSEVLQEIQSLQTEDTDLSDALTKNQTVISNIEKFFKQN